MRIALIVLSGFSLCMGCCGPQLDAQSAYNAADHIADAAEAGKAASRECKKGGAAAETFCPKVDEAFDDIANASKGLEENAKNAGGAK